MALVLAAGLMLPLAYAQDEANAPAGNPAAGKELATLCAACHGENGISVSPEVPNLAGQKETYLISALQAYQSRLRQNPIMHAIAESLKPEDIRNVAAYFSALPREPKR